MKKLILGLVLVSVGLSGCWAVVVGVGVGVGGYFAHKNGEQYSGIQANVNFIKSGNLQDAKVEVIKETRTLYAIKWQGSEAFNVTTSEGGTSFDRLELKDIKSIKLEGGSNKGPLPAIIDHVKGGIEKVWIQYDENDRLTAVTDQQTAISIPVAQLITMTNMHFSSWHENAFKSN